MTMTNDNQTRERRSTERIIQVNGVHICIDTYGNPADPALLLIAGGAGSMDWWEVAFCERIAAGQRFVIRYDNRDTGRSVSYPPGSPGYTSCDLIDDAVGILDTLDVSRAHLAGLSMGGGIAQLVSLRYPDRVATLTLFSTSIATPHELDLPPVSEQLMAVFNNPPPPPDWDDREAVINYVIDGERPYAGAIPFDAGHARTIAERVVDRTDNMEASLTNHFLLDSGEPIRARIDEIAARTLVVHGTHDPLFPLGHGEALAREIPDARLLALAGAGHQYPLQQFWDIVVPALVEHTRGKDVQDIA